MRIEEAGVAAEDLVFTRFEGLGAVIGELADDLFFARVQCLHVHGGGGDAQAEAFPFLSEVEDLSGVEERFGRHAALEDAQTSELPCAIDNGNTFAERVGHPGGIEAGRATSDDDKIVGFGHRGMR